MAPSMQDYLSGEYEEGAGFEIAGDEEDELAGLEIAGYDESGAQLLRRKPKAKRFVKRPSAPRPKVYQTPLTKRRQYPVGIDSVANVAAAASGNYSAAPQVPFKPVRFIVTGPTNWLITDIKIGKNSQSAASTAMTADAFGPGSFQADLDFDTCNLGAQITVSVTNISAGPLRFLGTFLGYAVE